VYNAVQQISGLVIILSVYYFATSVTTVVRILVLDEDSVISFSVQMQAKNTSYSKILAIKLGGRWVRINKLKRKSRAVKISILGREFGPSVACM